ncbi:hypothetical protein [Paragemmobacter ruber]|uniref:Bacterial OB-fold domain-containing protein n=1 Tax=Paragemmobacter ruber TaxID=1985673 RepID=A0ABW9Y3M8_9RHOB|nr:hypothetical protein [Rhodobacter ruber]NBE07002.1 hypothetical protein [Rhodobacter ruber]
MRSLLILGGLLPGAPPPANAGPENTGPATDTVAIADLHDGTTATITGIVDRITGADTFRLRDDSGSVLVHIGPGIVPFDTGETVTLRGIVDRDFGRLAVYARDATRADGSRVTFDHPYE